MTHIAIVLQQDGRLAGRARALCGAAVTKETLEVDGPACPACQRLQEEEESRR